MNYFLKWFFAFITEILEGFGKIFSGLWNGLKQIFNLPEYISMFKEYSKSFSGLYTIITLQSLQRTAVSSQAFRGVTPSFHLSEYQFSKNRIQIFLYFHTTLCVTFSVTNVSYTRGLHQRTNGQCRAVQRSAYRPD